MSEKDMEYVTTCGLRVLHEMGVELITKDGKSINELFEKENKGFVNVITANMQMNIWHGGGIPIHHQPALKMSKRHHLNNGGKHPKGMKGKHHSNKTKQHLHNVLIKKYARIVKDGKNKQEKTIYSLRLNGKNLKYSINPQKLINWFLKEYPLEIIFVGRGV